jgi:hypothetical protein
MWRDGEKLRRQWQLDHCILLKPVKIHSVNR